MVDIAFKSPLDNFDEKMDFVDIHYVIQAYNEFFPTLLYFTIL